MDDSSDRRQATVPPHWSATRLDRFLAEHFPNYSRRQLRRVIGSGLVRINGRRAKAGSTVEGGDTLDLPIFSDAVEEMERQREEARKSTRVETDVVELYRDDDLLVVAKPAGLPVHGGAGIIDSTLIDILKDDVLEGFGLVHRLDKDTTGAIALVRGSEARAAIAKQFAESDGSVEKRYEAIVSGAPDEPDGVIDLPLAPPGHGGKARVDEEEGKPARTRYRTLETFGRAARLELVPETGRTHQLRAHLAAIGHPLLVDSLYAGRAGWTIPDPRGIRPARLARTPLHARELTLRHPQTGERVTVTAPLPADMKYALELLRISTARGRKRGGLPPAPGEREAE